MIRRFQENDLDEVMSIWITANMDAHPFIASDYLERQF